MDNITTSDFIKLGISKPLIQSFINKGLIERFSHGVYMYIKFFKDEYYILQKKYPFVVFSYNTALDILNLTNRISMNLDVTIPRGKTIRENYRIVMIRISIYYLNMLNGLDLAIVTV